MQFTFAYPFAFTLLLILPCFWRCRRRLQFYFPHTRYFKHPASLLSLRALAATAVFTLLVAALAFPQTYEARAAHERSGRDLVLVLDTSGSMAESRFDGKQSGRSKYETVIAIVRHFLQHRYDDNVGLVVFGSFAYAASPVTYDLPALESILEMTNVGIAGESTAIGAGIAQAVRSLSFGHAKEKVIVLMTDGKHNAGSISPREAVASAVQDGIKIYTIGIGKPSDYDAPLLERIAQESGGKAFGASDAEALSAVYDEIDSLEPSPLRSNERINVRPLYALPLLAAMVLMTMLLLRGFGKRT
jgi:Ca-activated chloride channel homolog